MWSREQGLVREMPCQTGWRGLGVNMRQVVLVSAMLITVAACGGDKKSSTSVADTTIGSPSTSVTPSTTTGPVVTDEVTTPAASGCDGTSMLVDCSFESPVVAVGGYQLFAVGAEFAGWTVIGAPGNVAPLSEAFTSAGFVWSAHDGHQTLDLTGLSNTATGVSQAVATAAGVKYNVSFWIGNVVDPGGSYGKQTSVNVLVDRVQIDAATNSDGAGLKSPAYKEFTVSFTATSSSTTIAFVNADPATDNSSIIDDITMTAAP